jgi:hypothetical protein
MPSVTYPGLSRQLINTLLIASCSTSKAVPAEDPQPLNDLPTFVKLTADLAQWVTTLTQAMEAKGGSSHFTQPCETQLAIERSGLYDLAMTPDAGRSMAIDAKSLMDITSRIPLYFGAHVKNSLGLAATLTALRSFVDDAAPTLAVWDRSESHRDIPITSVRGADDFSNIALHYAVANNVIQRHRI